jgi:hypothetical protein
MLMFNWEIGSSGCEKPLRSIFKRLLAWNPFSQSESSSKYDFDIVNFLFSLENDSHSKFILLLDAISAIEDIRDLVTNLTVNDVFEHILLSMCSHSSSIQVLVRQSLFFGPLHAKTCFLGTPGRIRLDRGRVVVENCF